MWRVKGLQGKEVVEPLECIHWLLLHSDFNMLSNISGNNLLLHGTTSLTSTVLFIVGDCSKRKPCWTDTHSTVPSKGGCKIASWGSSDDIISTAINTGCPPDGARNTLKVELGDCGVPITRRVSRGTTASEVHDYWNPTVRVPSLTTPEAHNVRGVHLHCYCWRWSLSSNSRKCISD